MQPGTIDHKASLKVLVCFQYLSFTRVSEIFNLVLRQSFSLGSNQLGVFLANLLIVNNPSCKYADSRYTSDVQFPSLLCTELSYLQVIFQATFVEVLQQW